jgi:hypothetical protein
MKTMITHNGEFTIKSPEGEHRTFQIKTVRKGALEGKRILSLLTGQSNLTDYTGFAFLVDDKNFIIWNKYRTEKRWQQYADMLRDMILRGNDSFFAKKGYTLLESTVCRICNRKLTEPESIESGIGPECRKRTGKTFKQDKKDTGSQEKTGNDLWDNL